MPYIEQVARDAIDRGLRRPITAGELNYAITKCLTEFIDLHTPHVKGHMYGLYNEVLGALEGAKQEFYRRVVGPYEDQAIAKHGDVY